MSDNIEIIEALTDMLIEVRKIKEMVAIGFVFIIVVLFLAGFIYLMPELPGV